jgi:nitrite reductase/ring-hydroxylating ferredoxin subunit
MIAGELVERVEATKALDGPAKAVQRLVNQAIDPTPVKNALNGTWLSHPAHPLFTDIPLGAWAMAVTLDWLGGKKARPAADRLVAIGILAAVPTAATGAAQYSDFNDSKTQRVGLVHAAANVVALGLFGWSYAARKRGRRLRGKALGLAGVGAMSAGGYLGGHMAFDLGIGVKRTAFESGPSDWTDAAALASLSDGKPTLAGVAGVDILLVREGQSVQALADRCVHMGGPLHEGEASDGCVTCPWHGSTFHLDDGSVVRSPAVTPQPRYETRVMSGVVQVRAAG